ncbi:alanine--glyoxylate aminotransferase family protein [Haladaptatus sp. AB618]|uniref:pyridoxal-phosphate-dependent aminotransferase family protein n=1 Tax=Haladaptatus sp. AB618 TaxID=2934173 RepID=UPI00209C322B|nr:alanine--glyoxylate aminotransferase family protein [Haladaptatus sp. AB618]MCO8253851.1 alanine--glyoxylate aminotransferase family protein [Haladaptatus sp. AB618]
MDENTLTMTPGPTAVPEDVREAMAKPAMNPDVNPEFESYYETLLDKLARVYGTDDDMVVLGGEGILGLETAVESLVAPGDDVLCLANGLYGDGFADFVEMAGGNPVVHDIDYTEAFDPDHVAELVESGEFATATMVHCETPTGLLNDFDEILQTLQDAGVLTIVDAVSSLGGTAVPVENIDVCLGASQKCFSSPPGLTTMSVSDAAWEKVEATEQDGFYTSLAPWQDADFSFLPYTHLVSNLYALEASLDRILDEGRENVFARHESAADLCRKRGEELGLSPFPGSESLCSPTVTAFEIEGQATDVQRQLYDDHDILVTTGLGDLEDDILRVGHMGYNATETNVETTMDALESVLD